MENLGKGLFQIVLSLKSHLANLFSILTFIKTHKQQICSLFVAFLYFRTSFVYMQIPSPQRKELLLEVLIQTLHQHLQRSLFWSLSRAFGMHSIKKFDALRGFPVFSYFKDLSMKYLGSLSIKEQEKTKHQLEITLQNLIKFDIHNLTELS